MNKPVKSSGNSEQPDAAKVEDPAICGIIMPIAEFGSRTAKHWASVLDIVKRAIDKSGLRARPVWENEAVDTIHERIIFNIFNDPIVVADVSCLNPNVMFEIGMRITLGKPIIMIGDKETVSSLPFDTKMIDHLTYDGALQFHDVEAFIGMLAEKIQAIKSASDNNSYRPFIGRMGPVEIVTPSTESIPEIRAVMNKLNALESAITKWGPVLASSEMLNSKSRVQDRVISIKNGHEPVYMIKPDGNVSYNFNTKLNSSNEKSIKRLIDSIISVGGIRGVRIVRSDNGNYVEISPSHGREITASEIDYFKICIANAENGYSD